MAKRQRPAPPETVEGLVAMLRAIATQVETEGITTMIPYRLTAAVRMSVHLADARLDVNRLPPE